MTDKKLIIIGGGPAGLAAAVAAADRGVDPSDILVLERDTEPGGILNQCIHAGFGLHRFGEELTGPEYSGRYIRMARERNIPILCSAMALNLTHDRQVTFVSPETGYTTLKAEAVILAMGCRERTRGALGSPAPVPPASSRRAAPSATSTSRATCPATGSSSSAPATSDSSWPAV